MDLFERMPRLESERVLLREMVAADAAALSELVHSEAVYRYEPTFLFERRYDNASEAIARMRSECFDTRESVLLAVCLQSNPDEMLGIAEMYDYHPDAGEVSIGGRLLERVWRHGIASEIVKLLTRYLIDEVGVRTIVTHVMADNAASAAMMQKMGYRALRPAFAEDWGAGEVLVSEYVYQSSWER